jgi:type IV pilus assembly protein PilP
MIPKRMTSRVHWLLAAAGCALVAGCGGNTRDLQEYIDTVKARPGGRIEPLPEIRPAPIFTYEPGSRRSPFLPDTPQQRVSDDPNAVQGPDPNRPREFLEQFPLDTLRMVDTLSMGTQAGSYGLVQTSDGLIHRVSVGNHMGQNYGRILSISESEIQLVEIIPDGLGGFLERPAGLGLAD